MFDVKSRNYAVNIRILKEFVSIKRDTRWCCLKKKEDLKDLKQQLVYLFLVHNANSNATLRTDRGHKIK